MRVKNNAHFPKSYDTRLMRTIPLGFCLTLAFVGVCYLRILYSLSVNQGFSVTVCMPATLKDFESGVLRKSIASILDQTSPPDKFILVLTGVPASEQAGVKASVTSLAGNLPLTLVVHEKLQNQAQSRNEAIALVRSGIVSFFDADDIMHPRRLAAIKSQFADEDVSLVLHNYTTDFSDTTWYSRDVTENVQILGKEVVCQSELETRGRQMALNIWVHHAHCSVRKAHLANHKFDDSPALHRFEDAIFVRKFLAQICPTARRAHFIPAHLSRYRSG